jgi:hypothetical protein
VIEDLANLGSPVRTWVTENCEIGPEHEASKDGLYSNYRMWCVQDGQTPASKSTWARDLAAAVTNLRPTKPRIGADRRQVPHYMGLRLKLAVRDDSLADLPVSA